jgi:hypothetical protein
LLRAAIVPRRSFFSRARYSSTERSSGFAAILLAVLVLALISVSIRWGIRRRERCERGANEV